MTVAFRTGLPGASFRTHSDVLLDVAKLVLERSAYAAALHLERERALVTLNSIGDAVISTDLVANVIYLNAVAESMTGEPRT